MGDENARRGGTDGGGRLGTFAGVFTPSVLTILGIILFLRLGYVVGDAGLGRALLVIAIANSISILTSFSLAAIATNFRVRGGGDYYLISRTLGPEFGGAIGLVLFVAQSISVAFYAIGFSEGVTALLAIETLDPRWIAGAALLPLFVLSWLGADWATRFQYGIMAVLVLAIGSFVAGAIGAFDTQTLLANRTPSGGLSFWALFALFFPAVTGFTQGVSMSGDLRDPAKSLPLGTFLAVGVSIVVYFGVALLLAGSLPGADLVADYDALRRVAVAPWLISAGLFAATLSSALASFLGAPRILQALAADKLFRVLSPFAVTTKEHGNPRRAVLLCFAIALGTVAIGDLNIVAPIVSMFFLISYGLLNYATYCEGTASSPSFRPRFRGYHPRLSLLGCLACGGAMLAIDPAAGGVALAVLFGIHRYLERTGGPDRWADSSRSARFQEIRRSLHAMTDTVAHDRDWRPVILAFSDDPARRERLIRFASWIEGGSGLTTAIRLLEGEGPAARAERARVEAEIRAGVREKGLEAFVRVVVASDLHSSFRTLLQAAGIGPIRPNIALFNWFDQAGGAERAPSARSYDEALRVALRHETSVIVLAAESAALERLAAEEDTPRRIDVWWRGDASSRLALLLAYLMTRTSLWGSASLRVISPLDEGEDAGTELAALRAMLDLVRIDAEPAVVPDRGWDSIRAESAGRTIAFVPLRVREPGLCDACGTPVPPTLEGLPPLALVGAAVEIALDAQPDEGPQAESARAEDEVELAEKRAREVRRAAEELGEAASLIAARLAERRAAGGSEEELAELEGELVRAEEAAAKAERRAVKAEARLAILSPPAPDPADPPSDERDPGRRAPGSPGAGPGE